MCMLTAVVPKRKLTRDEKSLGGLILSTLLLGNSSHANKDGVGIYDTSGRYIKWNCRANQVVFTEAYNEYLAKMFTYPTMGHVRAISTGVSAKEGAHPFVVEHILLAHNGTFAKYKPLIKEAGITDPDPVDSHVAAGLLAKLAGPDQPITPDMIYQVLEKLKGSYALLIADTTQPDKLWVVRGTSLLHIAEFGPFYVVNTSKVELEGALLYLSGVGKYLFNMDIEPNEVIPIKWGSINTLNGEGLKFERETPRVTAVQSYQKPSTGSYQAGGVSKTSVKNATTKEHIARVDWYNTMLDLPYLSPRDIDWAVMLLFEKPWYAVSHKELEVMCETLEEMLMAGSEEKEVIWHNICQICPTPYTTLAEIFDIQVPYFMHTAKELGAFYQTLKEQ